MSRSVGYGKREYHRPPCCSKRTHCASSSVIARHASTWLAFCWYTRCVGARVRAMGSPYVRSGRKYAVGSQIQCKLSGVITDGITARCSLTRPALEPRNDLEQGPSRKWVARIVVVVHRHTMCTIRTLRDAQIFSIKFALIIGMSSKIALSQLLRLSCFSGSGAARFLVNVECVSYRFTSP